MRVLVTAASKHGATFDIATMIGAELARAGFDVSVEAPEAVESVTEFDALVIGSGVYVGRWMASARDFVDRNAAALSERPVWIYSSGPVGAPLKPHDPPIDAEPIANLIGARGQRVFGGRVDHGDLGLGERAILSIARAQEGDFRPWAAVKAWSAEIAAELAAEHGTPRMGAPDTPDQYRSGVVKPAGIG